MMFDWGPTLPALAAERIVLRALRADDVADLFAIFGDREVVRYWSRPALKDVAAAVELAHDIEDSFDSRTLFQWGIATRADERVIGTCTLYRIDHEHRRGEIGFALGRAAWGRGYASEALARLIEFAFGELELERLEADVDPRNARSLATLERLGFQREGLLRERWHVAGEVQDSVVLGLLAHECKRKALSPR